MEKCNIAGGVILKKMGEKNAVLLLRRSGDSTFAHHWEIPRGHCDKPKGEDIKHCLLREIKEETGLDVVPIRLLSQFRYSAEPHPHFYFLCKMSDPSQEVTLRPDEHSEYRWVDSVAEVQLMVMPEVTKMIAQVLNPEDEMISYDKPDSVVESYLKRLQRDVKRSIKKAKKMDVQVQSKHVEMAKDTTIPLVIAYSAWKGWKGKKADDLVREIEPKLRTFINKRVDRLTPVMQKIGKGLYSELTKPEFKETVKIWGWAFHGDEKIGVTRDLTQAKAHSKYIKHYLELIFRNESRSSKYIKSNLPLYFDYFDIVGDARTVKVQKGYVSQYFVNKYDPKSERAEKLLTSLDKFVTHIEKAEETRDKVMQPFVKDLVKFLDNYMKQRKKGK